MIVFSKENNAGRTVFFIEQIPLNAQVVLDYLTLGERSDKETLELLKEWLSHLHDKPQADNLTTQSFSCRLTQKFVAYKSNRWR
jgi:hypothetical protein